MLCVHSVCTRVYSTHSCIHMYPFITQLHKHVISTYCNTPFSMPILYTSTLHATAYLRYVPSTTLAIQPYPFVCCIHVGHLIALCILCVRVLCLRVWIRGVYVAVCVYIVRIHVYV